MNNDEVKAALERLSRMHYPHDEFDLVSDYVLLAREYQCEHPPDEDEPITPEWLRQHGWTQEECDPDDEPYWNYIDENGVTLLSLQQEDTNVWAECHIGWPHDILARCQVRGLLRELTR